MRGALFPPRPGGRRRGHHLVCRGAHRVEGSPGPRAPRTDDGQALFGALLRKGGEARTSPLPGRPRPMGSVTGMPSVVPPFGTTARTWSSATCRSKARHRAATGPRPVPNRHEALPGSFTLRIVVPARLRRWDPCDPRQSARPGYFAARRASVRAMAGSVRACGPATTLDSRDDSPPDISETRPIPARNPQGGRARACACWRLRPRDRRLTVAQRRESSAPYGAGVESARLAESSFEHIQQAIENRGVPRPEDGGRLGAQKSKEASFRIKSGSP